ncbi:MAG: hypothetical protein ACREIU_11485 [Planctomycetota bacterium]
MEDVGVEYLVVGSSASMVYGEPRLTRDVDVVVDLRDDQVASLLRRFPAPDFYASEEGARRAVAHRDMFNVIHPGSGLKIDLIVRKADAFDDSRFRRKRRFRVLPDRSVSFASPEDVILKKLVFYRQGGSEKHLRDVAGILQVSGRTVDRRYLSIWVRRLRVADVWEAVLTRVETARRKPRVGKPRRRG